MHIFTLWSLFVLTSAMATFGVISFVKKTCRSRYNRMIFQNGIESKATLLGIEQVGPTESVTYRLLRLRLQVNRENDRNYVTEVDQKINIAQLAHLKIGSKVKIKYDPKRPKQVLLICDPGISPKY